MDFVSVKHKDLTEKQLNEISVLKAMHWPYPVSSQAEWIKNAYNENDIHLILTDNGLICGYVSLAELSVICDSNELKAVGISCLCVDKSCLGKGYGLKIMNKAFEIVKDNGFPLILLCKQKLVDFYKKCSFSVLNPKSVTVDAKPFSHFLMLHSGIEAKELKLAQNIMIDKNF